MINDYKVFSLHNFGDDYMSKEDIEDFKKIYLNESKSIKEKTKKFENLEVEFYYFFINLKENEMIDFMDGIKELILSKSYMSNYEKSYKILKVILNCLFSFVDENKEKYNLEILKKYFYDLWEILLNFRDEKDNYLIEKREYYNCLLNKM
ncbi:MAG: hypothetical protein Q8K30_06960 [Candidatus Gracilibacteria bacterium]|nr:hypothetical protein [Candidatus Gracilibacteria bacterium]